jgi:sigma-B regulation protein RsbU (phosphoserine phosphatase)
VTTPRFEAKLLYRRLDSLFGAMDPSRPQARLLERFLEEFFATLRDDLRLRAGALYEEGRDGFSLAKEAGETEASRVEILDKGLPTLALLFRHRVYIFDDAAADGSPQRLGLFPGRASAAILVGKRPKRHVLFFALEHGWVREELDFALNTVRAALGSRLMEERVRGSFREAAEIQQSLLMEDPPEFPGYDIACRSIPTEEVSGDFFDFFPFGEDMLGLSVGDASGHGLPAALLVRDVVTGLRMGIEKDLKVSHVFSKLNRVIHRSNLTSRFVSVFYAELETDGNLIYVNAGHQPPMVITAGETQALEKGGTVIGPLPETRFQRGIARLEPGAVLLLSTDGILERRDRSGEFFGASGLERVVRENRSAGAEEILDRLFAAAFQHGGSRPWEDDATAVVVKRVEVQGQERSSRR